MRRRRDRAARTVDSVYAAGELVGDAWSWLILRESLLHRVRRFNDFQRNLGLARETLSTRLDHLVRGQMLERGRPGARGSVDYTPTPRGKDFFPSLAVALRWGDDWCADRGETGLLAEHVGCHAPFRGTLSCAECGAAIDARDVEIQSVARASSELISATRQRAPNPSLLERVQPCSLARTLMVIGDRWSSLVVRECFLGTRRFDDFGTRLGVATNILAARLRHLEEHGVLVRQPYQEKPVRHEYRLTAKGMALYPIPLSLLSWGNRWLASGRRGIELTHRSCGAPLSPVLSCEACAAAVTVDDVSFDRDPTVL